MSQKRKKPTTEIQNSFENEMLHSHTLTQYLWKDQNLLLLAQHVLGIRHMDRNSN